MKDLINYLNDKSINYYILLNEKLDIIKTSENISYLLNSNFKIHLWLEDIGRFELFARNVKKERFSTGNFEITLDKKNYEKVQILATAIEGKIALFWGKPHIKSSKSSINNEQKVLTNFIFPNYAEIILDKDLIVLELISDNFLSSYLEENLVNLNFLNFTLEDDKAELKLFFEKVVEENLYNKIEVRLANTTSNKWVKIFARKIVENSVAKFYCFIADIDNDKNFILNLISEKNQALQLANHLEKTREQERKNMAREIHDEIGHALTSLKLNMNLLLKKKFMREDMLITKLNDMMKQIEETIRTVQQISSQLRPSILDHFGLIAALEWQAKEFQRQTSIRCKYSLPDEDLTIPENKTIAIFRIFQEILTNVARHSQATRVDVNLTIENNILELQVSDNGIGIKKEFLNSPTSLGLIGMHERAKLIEGKLHINSVINVGTTITLIVPLN